MSHPTTVNPQPSSRSPRDDGVRPVKVPLFVRDAELGAAISVDGNSASLGALVTPGLTVPAGSWPLDRLAGGRSCIVVDGLLTRRTMLAGTTTAYLYGPGDVVDLVLSGDGSLPVSSRWMAGSDGATVAVLGDGFERAAARWPALSALIAARRTRHAEELLVQMSILSLPRVEQRVLATFWQLADRWGTYRADRVTVPLNLTQELVGMLVGAKRPTVSLALTALAEQGTLERDESGSWHIDPASLAELEPHLPSRDGPGATLSRDDG